MEKVSAHVAFDEGYKMGYDEGRQGSFMVLLVGVFAGALGTMLWVGISSI